MEQGYDFDALVQQKMEQNKGNKNFDRDAAVEEVVANACEMVLKDSKAAQQLAEEKQGKKQKPPLCQVTVFSLAINLIFKS